MMSKYNEHLPRCQILPLPDQQTAVRINGKERLRWHFGSSYPRPFFYPLNGPSGVSLTRMGHPGASNHDHHRSVWFAHHQVLGIDFWSDQTSARIRQKHWLAYQDGDDQAVMAVRLGWYDGHDPQELLEQDLIAAASPLANEEWTLELQSVFRPRAKMLEFRQTNFGFLAVRVAKSIAGHFGGGQLTDSEGRVGEAAIFGRRAKWMDYSGPIARSSASGKEAIVEGITFFDHADNPGHPTHWHVRDDGWMGASVCMKGPITTTRDRPLRLRYLLYIHSRKADAGKANKVAGSFGKSPPLAVVKSSKPHHQFEVRRLES